MKTKTPKQIHAYKLNLASTGQNGCFHCPRCGTRISPDDDSENAYSIIKTTVNDLGLEEVVICCKKCTSFVHLVGFPKAQDLDDLSVESDEATSPFYVAHI